MMLIAAILGGAGLVCTLYRKSFLGFLIGIQLLVFGASATFVFLGAANGMLSRGHISGFFVILGSVAQTVVGFALATRLFYLKRRTEMEELRTLKH